MKYLYQQMIAFWVIILTVLLIVGFSFTQFSKQTMINETYDQMIGYGETIQRKSAPTTIMNNIKVTETVLEKQAVSFFYLEPDQQISYPESLKGRKGDFISTEDWQAAKEGKTVKTTLTLNILDSHETKVAMVLQPFFLWDSASSGELFAVMAIVQPFSHIEDSLSDLSKNMWKAFLISSIIALVFSYVIAKFQVNRINRMKKATRKIADGDFDVDLDIRGRDELEELAQDFNQMALALKDSHLEIERQEERRRQFMADAAHEMRTPLTTINGLLEGIAYGAISSDQEANAVALMQQETKRLIRLVNENLDYEKIRTNQIKIKIEELNGTDVLTQVVKQLKGRAEAAGNTLTLVTDSPVNVYADPDRFVQIVVNIIQNAIQFTTDGEIRVQLEKGYLETKVTISDTGIGMSEEEVKNIWDRYYKADSSRKNTKYGESGLGLSIVQQLVKLHHGTIQVKSEKGVGTTFEIIFPDQGMTGN